MNRTIKFRAFVEPGGRYSPGMHDWKNITDSIDLECGWWKSIFSIGCDPESTVYLMQFTGLLDKNGKEIYEGDIVYINHRFGPNITGEVLYDEAFGCYRIKGDNITDWVERAGFYEVIGNLYENSELI